MVALRADGILFGKDGVAAAAEIRDLVQDALR
jgi:hypothetical protein